MINGDTTHMTRSDAYVTTFMATDPDRDMIVRSVKRTVRLINAKLRVAEIESPDVRDLPYIGKCEVTNRWIVRIRGRLGKNSPHAHLYRRGGQLHRYSSQDIRAEHAERFDVYVDKRTDYKLLKD